MTREPLVTVASITAIASALVGLLVAFGVPLNDTQTAAVLGVVGVVAPLVVGLVARPKVTPWSGQIRGTVEKHRREAGYSAIELAIGVVVFLILVFVLLRVVT